MLRLSLLTALAKGCNKIRAHFHFLSRCCCCCCVLLLLPTTSVLKRRDVLLFLFWWLRCCCSSLIERDVMKKRRLVSAFCLIRVRNQSPSVWLGTYCCSPRFLLTLVLKQREVPATVSSFYVSVLYNAMLCTSIAAVVLGCFYFCPLDCDASVIVVDCAAVKTGCMLEKYIPAKGWNKVRVHFYFLVEVLLLLLLRAAAAAHISTEAEVLLYLFWWLRCCCSSLIVCWQK